MAMHWEFVVKGFGIVFFDQTYVNETFFRHRSYPQPELFLIKDFIEADRQNDH